MRKPTLGAFFTAATSDEAQDSKDVRAPSGARTSRFSRRPKAERSKKARRPRSTPRSTSGGGERYRSFRVSGLTFVVLGVLVAFVIVLTPGLRLYVEQKQELSSLQQAVADKQKQNDKLERDVARWSDPAYIKAQARDRLYYVMPGETRFLVMNDVAPTATPDGPPVSDDIQTTQVDWLGAIFSSGISAGLSTQTPEELQQAGVIQ